MKIGIIVCLVISFQRTEPYAIRCPYSSEWNPRARVDCTSATHYICLFNNIDHIYSESCDPKEYKSRIGRKILRSPGINEDDCSPDRYQPFKFTTTGNSDCVLDKSFCNEEGQVIANNGNTSTDRACRCDYTKGYVYVTTPRDICTCLPSEEDCTCYMQHCSVDYRCINTYQSAAQTCTEIRELTDNVTEKSRPLNDVTDKSTYVREAAVVVSILIVINIVLLGTLFTKVRPYVMRPAVKYRENLIAERCDEPFIYTVMPGDDLTTEWEIKSWLPVKSIIIEKNGEAVKAINRRKDNKLEDEKYVVKCSDELTTVSLTINKFESEDAGTYTCKVTNVAHLTNTCALSCLNSLPCKQSTLGIRKSMQYFPIFGSDIMNTVQLNVCNFPTQDEVVVVTVGQTANLECNISQNITTVKWFRYDNSKTLLLLRISDKYSGGTPSDPYLHIKSAVIEDAGRYVCRVKHANNDILTDAWKLKVMLQEKIYRDVLNHASDPLFVKTSTVLAAFQCLQDHGIVVLTGREGSGKSKMCLELASMCENIDYLPYEIDLLNVDKREFGNTKILYIIDNVRFEIHQTAQLQKILRLPPLSKDRWIIITCRTYELVTRFKDAFKEIDNFEEKCFINLDGSLTEEEKRTMIERYLKANNVVETSNKESNYYKAEVVSDGTVQVKLDSEAVREIIKTEPFYGFPLTTVQFCKDRKHLNRGEKYFTDPPKTLVDEIKEMYQTANNDKNKIVISRYTVLLYLAGEDLVVSAMKINRFRTLLNLFSREVDVNISEIVDAADSMIGKYLTFEEGRYALIHPCISKAVLLSSEYCAQSLLIQNGPFSEIKEFVRSAFYEPVEGELIYKLQRKDTYSILFDRLLSDACKGKAPVKEIYSYMYKQFIKLSDDTFIQVVFDKFNDEYNTVTPAANAQACGESPTLSVQQIVSMLHGLTGHGSDTYIYQHKSLPNVVVSFGLLAACTSGYLSDSGKDTFNQLLGLFQKSFQQNVHIDKRIDIKGNTFFHYLTLYSEDESCRILDTDGLLSIDTIDKISKPNKMGVTPLEIAVFMGKVNVCKRFLLKEKCTNKKKERLLDLIQNGMSYFYGTGKTIDVFDITVNFEDEVRQGLKCGTKDDYLILYDLF